MIDDRNNAQPTESPNGPIAVAPRPNKVTDAIQMAAISAASSQFFPVPAMAYLRQLRSRVSFAVQ